MGLNFYKLEHSFIKIKLRESLDFISQIELNMTSRQSEVELEYNKLSEEQKDDPEIVSYFDDEYYTNFQLYPNFVLGSILVSQLSLFEYSLKRICKQINYELKLGDSFERSDFTFKKSKEILKKKGVEVGEIKGWDSIMKYKIIRNIIVHHDMDITPKYQKQIKNISKIEGLYVDEKKNNFRIVNSKPHYNLNIISDEVLKNIIKQLIK